MADTLTWTDRLKGWISWALTEANKLNRLLSAQARFQQDMVVLYSREQLVAWWNSLTEEQRADPKMVELYNNRKANLPYSDTTTLDEMKSVSDDVAKWMTDTYMKIEPASVSGSFEVARALVALDASKDIAIGVAGLITETGSAGAIKTTNDYFKFLRAKTGYGGVMSMVMKAPLEMSLMRPLSYFLHDRFRNELPDAWDIADMSVKGNLANTKALTGFNSGIFGAGKNASDDFGIFSACMGYKGFEQWYIDAKWDSRWRELRLGEIAWALTDSLITDADLDRMLQYAKYSPGDRPIITEMIKARYLRPYRDRVASQLRNMYKEGYITYADFKSRLQVLKIPDTVIFMMASEADYLYHQDHYADLRATWLAAYKNDTINEDQYRGNLKTIMVDPLRIEGEINKAKAQRKPAAAAKPKPQTQGIKISSKPSNAMIFLDDVDTGRLTPDTIETPAGTHTLTVSADGYEDAGYQVTVDAGQFVELYAALVPLVP